MTQHITFNEAIVMIFILDCWLLVLLKQWCCKNKCSPKIKPEKRQEEAHGVKVQMIPSLDV